MDISNINLSICNIKLNKIEYNEEYYDLIKCRNELFIYLNKSNYNINFYYKYVYLLFIKYIEYISFDPNNIIYKNTTNEFKNILVKIKDNITLYIKDIYKMPISKMKLKKTYNILNDIIYYININLENNIENIINNEMCDKLNKTIIS